MEFFRSSKVISGLFLCFSRHLGPGPFRSNRQRGRDRDSERQVEPESRGNRQQGFVPVEPSAAEAHARAGSVV